MRKIKSQETRDKSRNMRPFRFAPNGTAAPQSRCGATLSEILISLLVMSVGVVSLATLFPISVLRSIQATQLTNATILRQNVEQFAHVAPELIHNPAGIADPAAANFYETNDNPILLLAGEPDVAQIRYIVDPTCYARSGYTGTTLTIFGNETGNPPAQPIHRYPGNSASIKLTDLDVLFLPDSWQLLAKGTVIGSTPTQITVPPSTDLVTAANAMASSVPVRVVVMSNNGRSSEVRTPSLLSASPAGIDVTNRQVNWDTPFPLPSDGRYTNPARFRLESRDLRYSWLLTIRKGATYQPLQAETDVVVFFNRAFKQSDEQIYYTDAANGYPQYSMYIRILTSGQKPFLKKGGYFFDADNAHWYRITNLKNENTATPIIEFMPPARNRIRRIMALPGIVFVYTVDGAL